MHVVDAAIAALCGVRSALLATVARVDATIQILRSVRDHVEVLQLLRDGAHGRSISHRCPRCGHGGEQ